MNTNQLNYIKAEANYVEGRVVMGHRGLPLAVYPNGYAVGDDVLIARLAGFTQEQFRARVSPFLMKPA